MHIGNPFPALIDKLAADSSNGIFYLRIEDTDKKREVDDAIDHIISDFLLAELFRRKVSCRR